MLVRNNPEIPSNNTNPNFKSIKKLECTGLYKKYPELGRQLVDTFSKNPQALDFCKKYDVNVYFHAFKSGVDFIESSIHIFYDNPAVSKMKKFFKAINNSEDQIDLSGFGRAYNLDDGMVECTNDLIAKIVPENSGTGSGNGLLDVHLINTDKAIQEALDEKAAKRTAEANKALYKSMCKKAEEIDKQNLSDSIKDLMDKTK